MDESGQDGRDGSQAGDDLPSGSHPVCPRCGMAAGDTRWCASCGLNLSQQGRLPTADQYTAKISEQRWLAQQEAQRGEQQERQRREEQERRITQERARRPKRKRLLLAAAGGVLALVLAALAVVFLVIKPGGGSSTTTDRAAATVPTTATVAPTTPTVTTATTSTVTRTATVTRTNTGVAPPSDTGVSPPAAAPGPEETLRQHYEYLDAGHYEASFALMTSSFRAANPGWVADRRAGDPRIEILSLGAPQYSGTTARVSIDFIARDRNGRGSDTSCRDFSGTAALIMEGGAWRYDPGATHYDSTVVPASDPNCSALM